MIQELLQAQQQAKIHQLLSPFDKTGLNSPIEKSLSPVEFNEKYSVGYNVFDQQGIEKFKKDSLEKGSSVEEIDSIISTLEKVTIQKGENTIPLFVKKIESEIDEFSEEEGK